MAAISSPWPGRLAFAVAGIAFAMIVAGAFVTTLEAGDSVPDWPLAYGKIIPRDELSGGVVYEWGHRAVGAVLGLAALVAAVLVWRSRASRGVKVLAAAALAALVCQGLVGGLRVRFVSSPEVRSTFSSPFGGEANASAVLLGVTMVHAALGQTVLALFVALALVSSLRWNAGGSAVPAAGSRKLRRLAVLTTAFVFVQLVLGSYVRHTGEWVLVHLAWAFVVAAVAMLLSSRSLEDEGTPPAVRRPAAALGVAVVLQVLLGLAAWMVSPANLESGAPPPAWSAIVRSAHVALGAAILAITVALTLAIFGKVAPEGPLEAAGP
ncbi:MAG: COX15/CtaA family protein [Planctomycetes bacterium]|nr:COX15/CtaA family protein [Planctomycetota bacterium]